MANSAQQRWCPLCGAFMEVSLEIRNPKNEIRNKSEKENPKQLNLRFVFFAFVFVCFLSSFEFVSDFVFRISDFI
jgi:hypothetical protein